MKKLPDHDSPAGPAADQIQHHHQGNHHQCKAHSKGGDAGVARGALGALDDFDAVFAEAERGHALGAVHVQSDVQAVLIPAHQKAVDQILDDLAEGKSHDGEIVTAQTQDRNTDQNAENGSNGSADKDGDHKAYGRIDRALHALGKEGAGEGTDTHEACVSEAQLTEDSDGQV